MSDSDEGQLQDYSVDQLAGAVVLVLGAIAGLLQVIWMSKCHCKVNLCYIFRCERRPPTEATEKTIAGILPIRIYAILTKAILKSNTTIMLLLLFIE